MSEALGGGAKKSASSIRGIAANQIRGVSADQVRGAPSIALDVGVDEPMVLERGVSSSTSASPATSAPLGRPPQTSVEELTRAAASMLPEAPPPSWPAWRCPTTSRSTSPSTTPSRW